jgi:hypothetical protein
MEKVRGKNKSSIQSGRDALIAFGTLAIAFSVITLIMVPAMSTALPAVVAASSEGCEISAVRTMGGIGCGAELELPAGSVIWMCQYLVYSNETGDLIGIDLCNHDDWEEHGKLITEITGLDNQDEWDTLYHGMIYKECYVKGYLEDQGFYVISCLDCDCFWYLIDLAGRCHCPVRIVMYDCCCVISPIIPVFMY